MYNLPTPTLIDLDIATLMDSQEKQYYIYMYSMLHRVNYYVWDIYIHVTVYSAYIITIMHTVS